MSSSSRELQHQVSDRIIELTLLRENTIVRDLNHRAVLQGG